MTVKFDKNKGFPMEQKFVDQFGGKLITDLSRQYKDEDVEMEYKGHTFTFSIKHQLAAERTGNFSFEVLLEDTRTGKQRVGNFHENEADYYVIAANGLWYIWKSSTLHEYVMNNKSKYRYIHTNSYLESDNRQRGRTFDRAWSYLVPVSELESITNKTISQD